MSHVINNYSFVSQGWEPFLVAKTCVQTYPLYLNIQIDIYNKLCSNQQLFIKFEIYSHKYRKNDCLKLNVVLIRRNTFVYNWIQYRWIKVIVHSIAWKVHLFEVPAPLPGKIWTINTILSFLEDIQTDLELPNYDANAFTSQLNI